MYDPYRLMDPRRLAPRIDVEAMCSEIVEGHERHGMLVDVSHTGVRIARPYTGGRTPRALQLEFELPGIDEIIWAKGDVCFDELRRAVPGEGAGLVRTTGIRLAAAAARDLRMLRDYVHELRRARDSVEDWLGDAACYLRG